MAEKTADHTTETLARQIEELKSDLSNITRTLAQMEKAGRASVADRLRERTAEVADMSREQIEELRRQAAALPDQIGARVREQPALSLGIAVGAGLLVGLLLRRAA